MATILVIDDLAANRAVLVSLLGYQRHRLLEAGNGRDGLAIAGREPVDLIITDVLMPIMDGYELVRRLRLDPATARIPVIFYTAHYAEHEARALALSSGVAHVLTKPIDPQEVTAIVAAVLAGPAPAAATAPALTSEFDQAHLRLVTDKLSRTDEDLRAVNARLRALVNIGLELASERDGDRLLRNVCGSAHELFGASYVTLGATDRHDDSLRRVVASGATVAQPAPGEALGGLLHTVVSQRRAVRGENAGGDPGRLGFPAGHPPVHAYLIAPIVSPAHTYGWLCLVGNDGRAFDDSDEQLLVTLASLVGRIYENGYFYRLAKQERDRAQHYLDAADVILLGLDLDGRIEVINRRGCSLVERAEADLLGTDWLGTCVPAEDRPHQQRHFADVLAGRSPASRTAILARSGARRLIEWRSTALRDGEGRVVGTLSSGADVTEQHQAEAALRAAEERTRFALESAGIGIWDLDYAARRIRWSPTLEAHHGLAPGSFGGGLDEAVRFVHPDDLAAVSETMARAERDGGDFTLSYRVVWSDGSIRRLVGAGRVQLGPGGTPVRSVGISQDVTERRLLEEQFYQAQKMEAIGRLAGGIAHDFNNLLTAILGYCELLLVDRSPGHADYGDIEQIQKAGLRASALTRQLLAFSRKQIIAPASLDVNAVIADLRPMIDRLIGEDVRVAFVLRPGLGSVVADRGQVEQIVMNLVVNARDAMPTGGALTIETANVALDEHYLRTHLSARPGDYVALVVTDTGTGMTQEVQSRIFEPFYTTKEPGKGTGLGLATVHGIVSGNGGTIGVYSEIGRGTSFKIYLPHADGAEGAAEPAAPAPRRRGGGETILVVEDAAELRDLARRLLEREGYHVLLAANADEAVEQFTRSRTVDLLLSDVVMPGASGPEVMARLVAHNPHLRVIYMSGYTEDAITHHGVLMPGIDFLNKPFTADILARKVREVLDR